MESLFCIKGFCLSKNTFFCVGFLIDKECFFVQNIEKYVSYL